MTYDGTNYPINDHGILFWVVFLSVIITATFALMCLFIVALSRAGETVKVDASPAAGDPEGARTPLPSGHGTTPAR